MDIYEKIFTSYPKWWEEVLADENAPVVEQLLNMFRIKGVIETRYIKRLIQIGLKSYNNDSYNSYYNLSATIQKHLMRLFTIGVGFEPDLLEPETNTCNCVANYVSSDWIKEYHKTNKLCDDIICPLIHNGDIECLKYIISLDRVPIEKMFYYSVGTLEMERIKLIHEYGLRHSLQPSGDFFLHMLECIRVKYLRETCRENHYFDDNFLEGMVNRVLEVFEWVCTNWSTGIKRGVKTKFPEHIARIDKALLDGKKITHSSTSLKLDHNDALNESVDFFDYNGPIIFDGYWIDVFTDHNGNVDVKLNKTQIHPRRNDLLFYKEFILGLIEERLRRLKKDIKKAVCKFKYDLIEEWPPKSKNNCFTFFEEDDDEVSNAILHKVKIREFYIKMAMGMNTKKKFPIIDSILEHTLRREIRSQSQEVMKEFISKDVCEYVLSKYI